MAIPRRTNAMCRVLLGAVILALSGDAFSFKSQTPGSLQSRWGSAFIRPKTSTASPLRKLQMSAKQEDTTLLGGNSTSGVPSLFEPGAGPTVVLDGVEDVYRQAIQRTLAWVAAAGVFGGILWTTAGASTGEEFFAGYLVEQSLSVDNLFVFLLLFDFFGVPIENQDRVLNWGIYGAIVMRAVMIGLGAAALENFHAILLVFAGILVYSSAKVILGGGDDEKEEDLSENTIVKFAHAFIDSTDKYDGGNFFTLVDGVRKATPLFICMLAVEISDVVFAVDSIPAVFGVTSVRFGATMNNDHDPISITHIPSSSVFSCFSLQNPLVVFSSNMFAIMGLRSLYTILSKAATDLKYLEPAVAVVLGFIGVKMIAEYFGYCIATPIALAVVITCLGAGVGLSVRERQQSLLDETPDA